jgi:hypothetical protein
MSAFSKYDTYAVAVCVSRYGDLPMLYNAIDENGFPFSPVCPYPHTDPVEAFAIWWRVITFYLSEGNWRYLFDNNLLNPFEKSLGELGRSYTHEYRTAFDSVVSFYNRVRETQTRCKTAIHEELRAHLVATA